MFCLIRLTDEAGRRTFQVNELDNFSDALQVLNLSVYLHVLAIWFQRFLQSYLSMTLGKNIHLRKSHMTDGDFYFFDGWGFLNNCLTFLVIQLIRISYLLSVKTSKFFMKGLENSSFFGQYGISTNTTFERFRTCKASEKLSNSFIYLESSSPSLIN